MLEMQNEDKDLEEIFHGEQKPLHPDTIHVSLGMGKETTPHKKTAQKPTDKAVDAQWEPVKPKANYMEKLKSCAKSVILFGGLSFLVFYWKEAGLMAESIAVPAIAVCTALAGFGCGKNAMRGANR